MDKNRRNAQKVQKYNLKHVSMEEIDINVQNLSSEEEEGMKPVSLDDD
jgi:hypothetical protein